MRAAERARRLRELLERFGHDAVAAAATAPALVAKRADFALAFVATAIFYLPAIVVDAGFLYGGDVLGWYLPALAKTHSLIHGLNFTAIDYSQYNGSSDYFLSPNFFAYHPLVVLYCLLAPAKAATLPAIGKFLVAVLALHSFAACYFAIKLFRRYFSLEYGAAALIGVGFAFSPYMVNALHQPPFLMCAALVPWAAYAALIYQELGGARRLLGAAVPVFFGFTAGYLPLGIACLALAAALVAARLVIYQPETSLDTRLRSLATAAQPFLLAFVVVLPYLLSVVRFHSETTSSTVPGLFYSAHQLAELPQGLLRALSTHFRVPGPYYEFTVSWGLIAILVAALFLLTPAAARALVPREWQLLTIGAVIYFATVLAIYGQHSVVSDLVFYYVPGVGRMHIYQRFLLPAHLMFAMMVALMLKALVEARPPAAPRIALAAVAALLLACLYAVARHPAAAFEAGLDNYVAFELFLALLLAIALLFPGRAFVFGTAALLTALPVLDRMYDLSQGANTRIEHARRSPMALDAEHRAKLVAYLGRFGGKEVLKYVDITPMWTKGGVETFPKVFPYFVLNEARLSSYGGFTFYLSARGDFMRRMPVEGDVAVRPDWEYVLASGADFAVVRAADLDSGALASLLGDVRREELFRLPNEAFILPLRQAAARPGDYDNGYVRISAGRFAKRPTNVARGKPVRQSSTAYGGVPERAVDGNTLGDYPSGAVTHTALDPHAWLEIDLGSVMSIDTVRVWNRSDCCGHRLRDWWVFISEKPFQPGDRAADLKSRPGTWGKINFTPNPVATVHAQGARGRYVRVQLSGAPPADESYLSLGEVEVFPAASGEGAAAASAGTPPRVERFSTDHASGLRVDFETAGPARLQYLFWDNPRLTYRLDGKRIAMTEDGGLLSLEVPPGRHTFEVSYRHWGLTIFWLLYALFAIACLIAVLPRRARAAIAARLPAGWLSDGKE